MTLSVRHVVRSASALVVALGACDSDSSNGPAPFTGLVLDTLGRGSMTQRHMAEVWTHGDVAYTSTWGSRNGAVGNAVHIWRVDGAEPVLAEGRMELLWYLREQSVCLDYHRYGNLGERSSEQRRQPQ